ncbi:septal ring lytic transglycosylase RlpA family protein [Devosia sp. SL43]|uniref:septal ring lytic transglycosylase RlpA family protein n=1 Tax=Devosia sp. SL43 TaxID=2806348 RepID=UPI0023511425|nr:septal ring lytic transglycosylase RlpA family protein [Devosia sp. SL43]
MTTTPWRHAIRFVALAALVAPMIAACGGGGLGATVKRAAFGSEYGSSSPRVTNNPNPPKGGGRYQVGRPYTVNGRVYTPAEQPGYVATGDASWYGADFHGRRTANGEIFSANAITGAHPTLPLPSYVRVTNQENGRSVIVRVNDRGPYMPGRIMDLSHRAAEMLGYVNNGHASIKAEYVGRAPLEGDDTRMLLASYSGPPVQSTTRYADGTNSLTDMAGDFFGGLFSYADTTPEAQDANIGTAFAAVNAVAAQTGSLDGWVQSVDVDARDIKLGLGIFADQTNAVALAEQFALLGSVDEEQVTVNGKPATRLTLTHLKPGVARIDALDLARQLGLNDIILY